MDRIWQWAWNRHGPRFTWTVWAISCTFSLPIYLFVTVPIVAFEDSARYLEVIGVTACAVPMLLFMIAIPSRRSLRPMEQWAAGHDIDRTAALEGTYTYAREAVPRSVWITGIWLGVLSVLVGAIAGATGARLVQYALLGALLGTGIQLIAIHNIIESVLRPARVALSADAGIGDSLPRSRPTFATRSNISVVAVAFSFSVIGAFFGAVVDEAHTAPRHCRGDWLRR